MGSPTASGSSKFAKINSPQELRTYLENEYQAIDQLWNSFDETEVTKGMDSGMVQQIRTHVISARDALKRANDLVVRAT